MKQAMRKFIIAGLLVVSVFSAAIFTLFVSGCKEEDKEYAVIFEPNGGTASGEVNSLTVKQGETLTAPAAPEREGYAFAGWAKDEEGLAPWVFSADTVWTDTTLYAIWTKLYTVTLDANGGAFSDGGTTKQAQLAQDSYLSVAVEPMREGYKLRGWSYDAHGKQSWNLNQSKVTENATLYAVWAKNYEIVFDANGGEFEAAPAGGTPVTKPDSSDIYGYKYVYSHGDYMNEITEPVRDNYIFTGWFTSLSDGKIWDFETSTVDGNLTLYARWEEAYEDYDVTYKLNYEGAEDVILKTENGLALYEPDERTGYKFNGWWYGNEENGKIVLTEEYDPSERLESDTVLYADWIDETKVIKLLSAPQITRDGASFTWREIDGAVKYIVEVRNGNEVLNTYDVTATQWTFSSSSKYQAGVNYGVYIKAVGNNVNTVTSAWASSSYLYMQLASPKISFDATTNVLSWTLVQNASSYKLYINNEEITSGVKNNSYDMTSYEAGTYSARVEIVSSYGYKNSQSTVNFTKYKILTPEIKIIMNEEKSAYKVTVAEVKNADVYVIEINGENYETVKKDENFTSDKLTFDFSFTDEIWGDGGMTFKVRAENCGSYYINSEENEIEISKPVTVNLAVEGETDNTGTAVSFDGKTFNDKLSDTLSYTVEFDVNGGSGTIAAQTVTPDNPLVYPSRNPVRSGYVFRGWFATPECEETFDFTEKVNKNITLYAGWHEMNNNSREENLNNRYAQSMTIDKNNYSRIYYAAYKSGKVKFTFTLSKVTYVYVALENATQKKELKFVSWNTSMSSYTAEAEVEAGDVIYVAAMLSTSPYVSVPNSLTFYSQVTDVDGGAYDNTPLSGGTFGDGFVYAEEKGCKAENSTVMAGQPITLNAAESLNGKSFVGWYSGEILISEERIVTLTPEEDLTYTAVYSNE